MPPNLFLIRAPDMDALQRVADRYEATGEGRAEFSAEFLRFLRHAEVLAAYVAYLSGKPSPG